jgi:hypothetical protein
LAAGKSLGFAVEKLILAAGAGLFSSEGYSGAPNFQFSVPAIKCHSHAIFVDTNSRGFDNLMKSEKALKGERGRTFAEKLMDAMSRVNTNIPRPKLWADDRQEYYPLSVILMDREVEFVEENGSEDLPRGFDVDTNKEVYQFSEANGESRVARGVRESDIPMEYLRMIASQVVQNTDRVKVDSGPAKAEVLSAAPAKCLCNGYPSQGQFQFSRCRKYPATVVLEGCNPSADHQSYVRCAKDHRLR